MTGEMGLEASLVLDVASPGAAWAAWAAALEAAALEAAAPMAAREAAACRGGGSASSTHEIEHGRTWLGLGVGLGLGLGLGLGQGQGLGLELGLGLGLVPREIGHGRTEPAAAPIHGTTSPDSVA